ncbi:hypothetical protein BDW02DRAFT_562334 [Decorospora gaudefroyi]|uniref:Uncharacterized protein n=1 Tax=Decorospora gaudefroyi TaxID=184978 RepID=A0A6A5JYN2_9PLEO|nr:hypothetical protein BDW02DRAFT_562334 [Decorospora gaudefroyi]
MLPMIADANNPVREVWDQAQMVWGPEPLEGKVKCLISIGTGVPSLKPFKDDVLHISETLVAIATETEATAERFRRERALLESNGRYCRFNVVRGLEDIGLEEAKKVKEMAAATRLYISSQEVHKQMQACAANLTRYKETSPYLVPFTLEDVPRVSKFVDRPAEMMRLELALLPRPEQSQRQRIHVLHGLGGMGKTQLTVEFARRHHHRFSSVFWLDGRSEDTLKRSIAGHASRIPQGQITETSRTYAGDSSTNVDAVVRDVMAWLARSDNTAWLLIFDNVDREYSADSGDADAYDVKSYFSVADHGTVLIRMRLARLEQLGDSQQLGKVSKEQEQTILDCWYKRKHAESERLLALLALLDGLPLAIAQAGAYLQEIGLATYLRFYEQQWSELMELDYLDDDPLQDYPGRSVWTTWAILYQAIRNKHEDTANLLLLWSFLDNKDLWHGLFAAACRSSTVAARMLSGWVGDIATSEVKFSRAMQLLHRYSLVEEAARATETTSYATHPVVHQWAHHSQGKRFTTELSRLAVVAVGWAVPASSTRDYSALQRRLLPHAQACSGQIVKSGTVWCGRAKGDKNRDVEEAKELNAVLDAVHCLGLLYADQGKLGKAEQMYDRALRGYEEALGPTYTLTLATVGNLGNLYKDQGKLGEAEQMYERALRGYEEALGSNLSQQYRPALNTLENMGDLYALQAEIPKAQAMYARALSGLSIVLGQSSKRCMKLAAKIDAVPSPSRQREGQSKLPTVVERSAPQHDRTKKSSRLPIRKVVKK